MNAVGLVSLGCPRNLVDSEIILGSLKNRGYRIVDIEDAEVAIINTCSFVESARSESVDVILQALDLKARGKVRKLIVAGCLAQGYHKKMAGELREVDAFVGTSDFHRMPEIIEGLRRGERLREVSSKLEYLAGEDTSRYILTPRHYAYLKISEGCDNLCSYCVISRLRGPFRSRRLESILKEATELSGRLGAREINIIGQDTTMYGMDIYGRPSLPRLLRALASVRGRAKWLRLLYTHPAHYTDSLIDTIAGEEKVCKYLDLPIQHINDKILKRMNRKITRSGIIRLIDKLRSRIKGVAIRTSVIVGFPGETDKEFGELLEFLREAKFERLGAFIFSREEGTKAHSFRGQVDEKEKRARLDEVMKLQQSISEDVNRKFLGQELDVLIDEESEEDKGVFLGRTQYDAPEVDGMVYVRGSGLKPGDMRRVRITDTLEYDLVGKAI